MKCARWAVLSIVLSSACGDSDVTIEEFVADYRSATMEIDRISAEVIGAPTSTGNLEADKKLFAWKLRADAAKFDSVIERLRTMKVPSDSADAQELRRLTYESTKLTVDSALQIASALENGDPPPDISGIAEQMARNNTLMADHAEALGMDSSNFRVTRPYSSK